MMKVCRDCYAEKALDDFPKHPQMVDGHLNFCRPCVAKKNRKSYLANRDRRLKQQAEYLDANPEARDKMKARAKAQKLARKQVVMDHLHDHPCVDCGESDPVVLEFDHVRGEKFKTINTLVRDGCAKGVLEAEIEKCDVVCVNCHTKRTAAQQGWYTDSPVIRRSTFQKNPALAARRKKNRDRNRRYVHELLADSPCVDCGEREISTLQFDHVRGTKTRSVSLMVSSAAAISTLQAEIDKCDVVCGNCHRIRTSNQFGSYRGYLS